MPTPSSPSHLFLRVGAVLFAGGMIAAYAVFSQRIANPEPQAGNTAQAAKPKVHVRGTKSTQVLEDLRQIDTAVDQWAIENNKTGGGQVNWADVHQYIKSGTRHYLQSMSAEEYAAFFNPFESKPAGGNWITLDAPRLKPPAEPIPSDAPGKITPPSPDYVARKTPPMIMSGTKSAPMVSPNMLVKDGKLKLELLDPPKSMILPGSKSGPIFISPTPAPKPPEPLRTIAPSSKMMVIPFDKLKDVDLPADFWAPATESPQPKAAPAAPVPAKQATPIPAPKPPERPRMIAPSSKLMILVPAKILSDPNKKPDDGEVVDELPLPEIVLPSIPAPANPPNAPAQPGKPTAPATK